MKPQETQCIKHILEFYIGNRKGVATALNKVILEYPIRLIQIQCKVMWMHFIKVSSSIHYGTESLKGKNKHRSCACNAVH